MNASLPACYSAAQIAVALGLSKSGVRKAMASVHPAAESRQRGGKTFLWRLDQLPKRMRNSLAESAVRNGYKNVADFLDHLAATKQRAARTDGAGYRKRYPGARQKAGRITLPDAHGGKLTLRPFIRKDGSGVAVRSSSAEGHALMLARGSEIIIAPARGGKTVVVIRSALHRPPP